MKILLVTQYYFPETGATSNRIYSLAKTFQEEGHDVTVLAEKPNHPVGEFFEGYEKGIFLKREYKGIPVLYTWVYTRPDKSFKTRVLFYITFMIMAVFASFKLKGKFDVVLATSPPLFVAPAGYLISKIKRAKFVLDVRDLWPDVAVAMGELNTGFVYRVAKKLELFLYRKADRIYTVTERFKDTIVDQVSVHNKVKVFSNGTFPDIFTIKKSVSELRSELNLPDSFIVTFAGNLGSAQGLDHIVQAAWKMNGYSQDVVFLILGEGSEKERLIRYCNDVELQNVLFRDRVPLEKAAEYLAASDVLLVSLADDPLYEQFVPSKLFDSMAVGKPVLLSVNGESSDILNEAEAGITYPPEDATKLIEIVQILKKDKVKREELGRNGYTFVRKYYSRDVIAKNMLKDLEEVLS